MVSIGESIPVQNSRPNHEKVDVVHVLHALKQGKQNIYVHTVDTDFVVIIAGIFHNLVATQYSVLPRIEIGHGAA